jgi:LysR family transcriptional regulator, regulator for metE and metH
MLEIRHLRSLLAIADHQNLSAAAERVHLTQSALSHQIRAIEAHFGIALFDRTPQGLKPTNACARLLTLARDVLPQMGDAERDLFRMKSATGGELRIALECHTCFDWLMPVMDEFRRRWPEVEVDLVAGFHPDPLSLMTNGKADLVVGSKPAKLRGITVWPLFRFEILAVLANEHRLARRKFIEADDLTGETLITYPVPEPRIDVIREVLTPAGIHLKRRTAELTIAILQLVASRRGIAALPNWGLRNYIENDYVVGKRIGKQGLWSELHAVMPKAKAQQPFVGEFIEIVRELCAAQLDGITLL